MSNPYTDGYARTIALQKEADIVRKVKEQEEAARQRRAFERFCGRLGPIGKVV